MSQFVTDRAGRGACFETIAHLIDADDHADDSDPLLRKFYIIHVTPT